MNQLRKYINLVEAIQNTPRDLILYLTNNVNKLKEIQTQLSSVNFDFIDKYAMRDIEYGVFDKNVFNDIELIQRRVTREGSSLNSFIDSIDTFIKYKDAKGYNFYQYIISSLNHMISYDEIVFEIIPNLDDVTPTFIEKLYYNVDEDLGKRFLSYYEPFVQSAKQLNLIIPDMYNKLNERALSQQDKYRPKHEEIEKLYHATAYVNEIASNGFQTVKPADRYGVGNYGNVNTISFTHDLHIAKEIMRCLKELVLIANGKLKVHQIISWFQHEGIFDVDQIYYHVGSKDFSKYTIDQTVKLYNYFLWMSKTRRGKNPVFANITDVANTLIGKTEADVGIIVADVRIEDSEYLVAEKEFRVDSSQIISVKKFN